ncbi:MAG TPA: long-chain-fatty-acid--CoA ligase [Xanthobacteraceae bacterium]|jgi:acyl-CoA synthetase (AMP-forming)/AMP-acid ligase II|nr:long-chain-fatty-acid--CoA ligase [Xanthobacteraceae bacterium]
MIIGDIIKRNARLRGDYTGVVCDDRRFTHREFAARVYRAANALLARGVRQQERIAILARNGLEVLEVFGAGEVAGFIIVNINNRLTMREIEDICADARPSVMVFEAEFAAAAAALRQKFPDIRQFICIGGRGGDPDDYEMILQSAPDTEPPIQASSDDIAHIIYTSGSTGRPKGVMFQHKAMIDGALKITLEGGALEPVRGLIVMPLFHIGARVQSLAFLLLGGMIVIHRAFDPRAVLKTIEQEKITATHLAPAMIQRILEIEDKSAFDARSLHCVRYASAPMPVPLLRRAIEAFGPIFNQIYGMTECLGITTLKSFDHKLEGTEREVRRLSSAGQASLGVDLRIVRDDGTDAPPGEIGEILIRSDSTMLGYWNNHLATLEAMRDGWLHSQDLGIIDDDGFLFILDRKKDMIVSGGENIYSWEVEEALRHHPAVAEAAVIAVPDTKWGESVKACIVLRTDAKTGADELIEYCRSRIGSYKKPRSVDFMAALPRLFNGKIDKKALRAPYWANSDRQVS